MAVAAAAADASRLFKTLALIAALVVVGLYSLGWAYTRLVVPYNDFYTKRVAERTALEQYVATDLCRNPVVRQGQRGQHYCDAHEQSLRWSPSWLAVGDLLSKLDLCWLGVCMPSLDWNSLLTRLILGMLALSLLLLICMCYGLNRYTLRVFEESSQLPTHRRRQSQTSTSMAARRLSGAAHQRLSRTAAALLTTSASSLTDDYMADFEPRLIELPSAAEDANRVRKNR